MRVLCVEQDGSTVSGAYLLLISALVLIHQGVHPFQKRFAYRNANGNARVLSIKKYTL